MHQRTQVWAEVMQPRNARESEEGEHDVHCDLDCVSLQLFHDEGSEEKNAQQIPVAHSEESAPRWETMLSDSGCNVHKHSVSVSSRKTVQVTCGGKVAKP